MPGIRQYPRYTCPGGVEIHVPDTNRRLWGNLGDISRAGLYMETPEPWPVGTHVEVRLEIKDLEIQAKARIVTCHPGVGMGMAVDVHPAYVEDIEDILAGLAAGAGDGASTAPYR